jgi:hypothetical protein
MSYSAALSDDRLARASLRMKITRGSRVILVYQTMALAGHRAVATTVLDRTAILQKTWLRLRGEKRPILSRIGPHRSVATTLVSFAYALTNDAAVAGTRTMKMSTTSAPRLPNAALRLSSPWMQVNHRSLCPSAARVRSNSATSRACTFCSPSIMGQSNWRARRLGDFPECVVKHPRSEWHFTSIDTDGLTGNVVGQ